MRLVISIVVSVLPLFLVFACAPVEVSPEEATFANVTAIIEEFCIEYRYTNHASSSVPFCPTDSDC